MQDTKGVPTEAYNNTPQGEATEGNPADDILMVDQGQAIFIDMKRPTSYTSFLKRYSYQINRHIQLKSDTNP